MAHLLRLRHGPCETWQLPRPPALTITNPPWGRRLMERGTERGMRPADSGQRRGRGGERGDAEEDGEELRHTWKQLANFCKVRAHPPVMLLTPCLANFCKVRVHPTIMLLTPILTVNGSKPTKIQVSQG